jgi:hypothetical protein
MKFSENENYSVKSVAFANKFSTAPEVTVNFFKDNVKVNVSDVVLNITTDGFTIVDFEYDSSNLDNIPNCFTWTASGDFVDNITYKDTAKDYANLGVNMLVEGVGRVTNDGSFKVYRDDVEIYNVPKNSQRTFLGLRVNDKIVLPENASFTLKGIHLQAGESGHTVVGLNSRFSIIVDKPKAIDLGRTGVITLTDDVEFEILRNGEKFDGLTILENDILVFRNSDHNNNICIESSGITFNTDKLDTSSEQFSVIVNSVQEGFNIHVIKTQRGRTIDIDSKSNVSIQRGAEIVGVLTHSDKTFEFTSGDILITNGAIVTGSDITVTRDSDTYNFTITDLGSNYKLQVRKESDVNPVDSGDLTESDINSESNTESGI